MNFNKVMQEVNVHGKYNEDRRPFPWKPLLIFMLSTLGLIVLISIYYNSHKSRIFAEQKDNLSSVAVLKVNQIELWYQERIGNATTIKDNPPLVNILHQFIESNNTELSPVIRKWMGAIRYQYDYSDILVLDTALKIKMSFSHSGLSGDYENENEARNLLSDMSIQLTDLKRNAPGDSLYMDILIPLTSERHQIFGILILRIDPTLRLFPLINLWPTPSKSSETLVFRKDGDSILFLNELRHKQNTALKLRLHINNESLLASKAIRGQLGLVEGVDYRGVPVEGYLSAFSHLPWFMVTKIDKEELLSPVNKYYIDSILISLLIFIINTFLFLNWNKSQRIRAIKKKLANETAIRELEEKFSTAFKSSPVSIVILLQSNNHFIDVNDSFTRDMGYTRDEVLGKTPKELNFWFDENEKIWILNEIKEKSNIAGKVLSLRTKSGDVMYGLTSVSMITVNGDQCYLITVVNITESKKSEQQLLESEDKFKYVFDHSLIGKSITLPTGEVNVNKAFCDMMGYSAEELTKLKWQDFTHPDDMEMTHNILNSILNDKLESVRFSKRYIKKDGSILWADISTTLRLDCKGIPQYFMTSVNDISERMLAEEILRNYSKNLEQSVIQRTEELEVANKELEAFTYSVSHDLRAPLRAVHGFSEILKEDYFKVLDDEGQRICSVISSSATQMSELIDDLLSFSRIGRSTVSATILNMEVIADTIAHELINQEQRKDIKYSIGKLNEVTGDPNLIKNVWYNLISNAIKYSSKQNYPEIFINSRKEGDYIIYSVKDNGVGFEMQYADKLFGVFQRLHSEYEFEGNGVGLAIVKRIINKHGGRIWAESEVGNGATFSFSLPAKEMLNLSESAVTSEQEKVNSEK